MELWRQHAENTARVLELIQEGLSVGEQIIIDVGATLAVAPTY